MTKKAKGKQNQAKNVAATPVNSSASVTPKTAPEPTSAPVPDTKQSNGSVKTAPVQNAAPPPPVNSATPTVVAAANPPTAKVPPQAANPEVKSNPPQQTAAPKTKPQPAPKPTPKPVGKKPAAEKASPNPTDLPPKPKRTHRGRRKKKPSSVSESGSKDDGEKSENESISEKLKEDVTKEQVVIKKPEELKKEDKLGEPKKQEPKKDEKLNKDEKTQPQQTKKNNNNQKNKVPESPKTDKEVASAPSTGAPKEDNKPNQKPQKPKVPPKPADLADKIANNKKQPLVKSEANDAKPEIKKNNLKEEVKIEKPISSPEAPQSKNQGNANKSKPVPAKQSKAEPTKPDPVTPLQKSPAEINVDASKSTGPTAPQSAKQKEPQAGKNQNKSPPSSATKKQDPKQTEQAKGAGDSPKSDSEKKVDPSKPTKESKGEKPANKQNKPNVSAKPTTPVSKSTSEDKKEESFKITDVADLVLQKLSELKALEEKKIAENKSNISKPEVASNIVGDNKNLPLEKKVDTPQVVESTIPTKTKDENKAKNNKADKNIKPEQLSESVLLKGTLIIKPEPEKSLEAKKSTESYAEKAQSKITKTPTPETQIKSGTPDKQITEVKPAEKETLASEIKQESNSSQVPNIEQKNVQEPIEKIECNIVKQSESVADKVQSNLLKEQVTTPLPLEKESKDTIPTSAPVLIPETKYAVTCPITCPLKSTDQPKVDSTPKNSIEKSNEVGSKTESIQSPAVPPGLKLQSLSQPETQLKAEIQQGIDKSQNKQKDIEKQIQSKGDDKPIQVPQAVETSLKSSDNKIVSGVLESKGNNQPVQLPIQTSEIKQVPVTTAESKLTGEKSTSNEKATEPQKNKKNSESKEENKPVEKNKQAGANLECSLNPKDQIKGEKTPNKQKAEKEKSRTTSGSNEKNKPTNLEETKKDSAAPVECPVKSKEPPKKGNQKERKSSESKEQSTIKQTPKDVLEIKQEPLKSSETLPKPEKQETRGKSPNKQKLQEIQKDNKSLESKNEKSTVPSSTDALEIKDLPKTESEQKKETSSNKQKPVQIQRDRKTSETKEQKEIKQVPVVSDKSLLTQESQTNRGKSPNKQKPIEKQKDRKTSESKAEGKSVSVPSDSLQTSEKLRKTSESKDDVKVVQASPALKEVKREPLVSAESLLKPETQQKRGKSPNKPVDKQKDRKTSENKDEGKTVQVPADSLEAKQQSPASVENLLKPETPQKRGKSPNKQKPVDKPKDRKTSESKDETKIVQPPADSLETKQQPPTAVESLLKPETQQKRGKSPNKQKPVDKQKDRKTSESKDEAKTVQAPADSLETKQQPPAFVENLLKPNTQQQRGKSPNKQKPVEKQKDRKPSESQDEKKSAQAPALEIKPETLPVLKPEENQNSEKSSNKQKTTEKQRDRKTSESKGKEASVQPKSDSENKKEQLTPTENLKAKDQLNRGKSPNKQKPIEDKKTVDTKDVTQKPEGKSESIQAPAVLPDVKQKDTKPPTGKEQVIPPAAKVESTPIAPTENKPKDSQLKQSEIVEPCAKITEIPIIGKEETKSPEKKPTPSLLESGINLAGSLLGFGQQKPKENTSETESQAATKSTKKNQNKSKQEETTPKSASSELAKKAVGKDVPGQFDDSDEDFIEYKFRPRTVFIANACNLCKSRDEKLIPCQHCKMVGYCSEPHRTEDLPNHQQLCIAICEVAKKRGGGHVYDNAKNLAEEDFRNLRVLTVGLCESVIKRPLQPFEREILLFPRLCCKSTCREWKQEALINCSGCGQISYCAASPDHLPASHASWCQSHLLFYNLIYRQHERGRIEPALPTRILTKPYQLPAKMDDFFRDIFKNNNALKDDCQFATLTQLATAPLTALYALQKSSAQITSESFTIHLVGAELQFEADTLDKWEAFLLHLIPGLNNLRIIFVGPELNSENLPLDILSRIRMCRSCRQSCKAVKFEFQCGKLYHEYVNTSTFTTPNLICAFNPGLHRKTGYGGRDTWPDTINAILRQNVPFVSTAYTEHEIPRDLLRIQECAGRPVDVIVAPQINPYASLKPDRNFISDEQVPLIFKNFYLTVVK